MEESLLSKDEYLNKLITENSELKSKVNELEANKRAELLELYRKELESRFKEKFQQRKFITRHIFSIESCLRNNELRGHFYSLYKGLTEVVLERLHRESLHDIESVNSISDITDLVENKVEEKDKSILKMVLELMSERLAEFTIDNDANNVKTVNTEIKTSSSDTEIRIQTMINKVENRLNLKYEQLLSNLKGSLIIENETKDYTLNTQFVKGIKIRENPWMYSFLHSTFPLLKEKYGFLYVKSVSFNTFPDLCIVRKNEQGEEDVYCELETFSSHFQEHKHITKMEEGIKCEYIICWKHDWSECPKHIEVIELCEYIK